MATGGTLPTRMTLKPSKLKWATTLLICLGFVAACVFIIPRDDDPTMWWLSVVFFSICALGSLPGLFGVGGLELDQEGFTILHWGKNTRRTWRECSESSILHMRGGPFVGFSSGDRRREGSGGAGKKPCRRDGDAAGQVWHEREGAGRVDEPVSRSLTWTWLA